MNLVRMERLPGPERYHVHHRGRRIGVVQAAATPRRSEPKWEAIDLARRVVGRYSTMDAAGERLVRLTFAGSSGCDHLPPSIDPVEAWKAKVNAQGMTRAFTAAGHLRQHPEPWRVEVRSRWLGHLDWEPLSAGALSDRPDHEAVMWRERRDA